MLSEFLGGREFFALYGLHQLLTGWVGNFFVIGAQESEAGEGISAPGNHLKF